MTENSQERWRLLLGRYSDRQLGQGLSRKGRDQDQALDFLYGREYGKRGIKRQKGRKGASLDPSQITALDWLTRSRELFPEKVHETLQSDAIERYNISDLLKDPRVLEGLEPSPALLRTLMSFHNRADPALAEELRRIAKTVIDELLEKLKTQITRSMSGRRNRHQRSPVPSAANFDARATIRANLANWDEEKKRIIAERLHFMSRQKRHLNWTIILCVDQSGSMTDSLIFSALIAAILTGLPGVQVKMVLFDTQVVDVTDQLDDPLDLLLSVQLGGGTNIGQAVTYCEDLIETPDRTVFALVSDFYEGASPRALLSAVARLNEARVRMAGIAALTDDGRADFDRTLATKLAGIGMNVAATSPDAFADWLAEVMA